MKMKAFFSVFLAVTMLLGSVGMAAAVYRTINTVDTVIDPSWPVTPTILDPNDDALAGVDIAQAWIGIDAENPTEISFRVKMNGPYDTTPDSYITYFQIDCDANNSYVDFVDIWIGGDPGNDLVWVSDRNKDGNNTGQATNLTLFTNIEFFAVGDDEFEFHVLGTWIDDQTQNGAWAACIAAAPASQWKIRVITREHAPSLTAVVYDTTAASVFDLPTAVRLGRFSAQTPNTPFLLGLGSLALFGLSFFALRRKRQ